MENFNIIKDLYEFHETVKVSGREITTKDYVKILDYKVDKDFLEEVKLGYVMEVLKYANGEEALMVERTFISPFPNELRNIMNVHRAIEGKSPLQISVKP